MDGDEVDLAAGAVADELLQPGQAHRRAGRGIEHAVRDGRGAEFEFAAVVARKWLHPGLVIRNGCLDVLHAGAAAVDTALVGLVEAHSVPRAGSDGGLDIGGPDGSVACAVIVEEWDVFVGGGRAVGG